jgi:uncharacterized repeat protein (TIGR01451 family)
MPHLSTEPSYHQFTNGTANGDLRLARCNNNTTCNQPTIHTLSSIGNVGERTSLELYNGAPVIAYHDETNRDLMLYRGSAFPITSANLSVAQFDMPDLVLINSNLTYTITVTNHGPNFATGIILLDTLPTNSQFVSAISGQGSCMPSGNQVTCDLGSLSSGSSTAVTLVVLPTALGEIANQAIVASNEADADTVNNTSAATTIMNSPPSPTDTPTDKDTPTSTYTPSSTYTPTNTYAPTNTYTPTNTLTPLLPTATATLTLPPAPPPYTPLPTLTASDVPTATDAPPPSDTPTPPPTAFLLPSATTTNTPIPPPPPFNP